LFDGDLLSALDSRIALVRAMRSSLERFSDGFWEADDRLAWLRMVRDEVSRSGRIRADLAELLELPPTALFAEAAVTSGRPEARARGLVALSTRPPSTEHAEATDGSATGSTRAGTRGAASRPNIEGRPVAASTSRDAVAASPSPEPVAAA
jgi:hypothetical protein